MRIVVDAVYEDGVFKPEQPVDLDEKTKVHLVIGTAALPAEDDDPTGWKTATALTGFFKGGPENGTENHGRYIYDLDEER